MKSRRGTSAARLAAIREEISDAALRLAYHAAVPVVIDPTLLNLLRVNFFLDPPDAIPPETEAALLLSPLFREIGEELYEIEPDLRNLLLTGLYSRYGAERVRRVALLLEQYTDATQAWHAQPELERAQQLAALGFVDPDRAARWLESTDPGSSPGSLGREWYVAMHRRLAQQSSVTDATAEIARVLPLLADPDAQVREDAVRALAALTHLPEADTTPVVAALTELIRIRSSEAGRVTPDIQAALSLIGALPRGDVLDFGQMILVGADLTGLDFSHADFRGSLLIDVNARGINLISANLVHCLIKDSILDGARLERANLRSAELEHVSLVAATLADAAMDEVTMQDVDLSRADLRGVRLVISAENDVRLDAAILDESLVMLKVRHQPEGEGATEPESAPAPDQGAVAAGQPGTTPRAALDLGRSLMDQGDLEGALAAYQQAIDSGDRDVVPDAVLGQADITARQGLADMARPLYEQALTLYREVGDRRGEARALAGLADIDGGLGEYQQAGQGYEQALAIFREVGDRRGEGLALADLGLVSLRMEKFEEARRSLEQAVLLCRQTGERVRQANTLLNLGSANEGRGAFDEAMECYLEASRIYAQLDNRPAQIWALTLLGDVALRLRRFAEAIEPYEQALQIYRDSGDVTGASSMQSRLALTYQKAGYLDRAIAVYEQILADTEQRLGPDHRDTQVVRNGLADAYWSAGRYDDALRLHEDVLVSMRRTQGEDYPATLAMAGKVAAELRTLGRREDARDLEQVTLTQLRRVLGEDHPDTLSSARNLAADLRALGELPEAGTTYPMAGDYYKAVQRPRSVFAVPELQNAKFAYDTFGPTVARGTSAVVFQASVGGRTMAVRCYIRNDASSRERYDTLNTYLASHDLSPYVSSTVWLDGAIRANGRTWPVQLMDWIDGRTLNEYVDFLVNDSNTASLTLLAQWWRELVRTLQRAEFAHGGLQHGDVIIDQKGRLRLVDYDAVWVPPMQEYGPPSETGHPNYQHPGPWVWGRWMDTFPALVIYLSLVALGKNTGLWPEFYTSKNLLFSREDFVAPFATRVWRLLYAMDDPEVDQLALCLQECCAPDWAATKSLDETIESFTGARLNPAQWIRSERPPASRTFPAAGDYYKAVQAPAQAFTMPELQSATFAQDSLGPVLVAGANNVVFQAMVAGRLQAVRCSIRADVSSRERYEALNAYLAERNLSPYVSRTVWLDGAIRVNRSTWPVLLMDWIHGRTLNEYVDYLVRGGNTPALDRLAARWRELVALLQGAEFAHCDLQHGNIMVDQYGQLRLVDYDGIWIPPLVGLPRPAESGHRNYRHPGLRDGWGRWFDTFSALVIYLSLIALDKNAELWQELYDTENLLFTSTDFVAPFDTRVWQLLAALHDSEVDRLARRLQECCAPDWMATKSLDDTIGT